MPRADVAERPYRVYFFCPHFVEAKQRNKGGSLTTAAPVSNHVDVVSLMSTAFSFFFGPIIVDAQYVARRDTV